MYGPKTTLLLIPTQHRKTSSMFHSMHLVEGNAVSPNAHKLLWPTEKWNT